MVLRVGALRWIAAALMLSAVVFVAFARAGSVDRPCGHRAVRVIAKQHGATIFVVRDADGTVRTELCDRGRASRLDSGSPIDRVQHASVVITDSRISRLRIAAGGTVAWISCKHGAARDDPSPNLGGACRSLRRRRKVYAIGQDPQADPKLLDSGRRIDPFSLTIHNGRVTWRHAGRQHSAHVPPPTNTIR